MAENVAYVTKIVANEKETYGLKNRKWLYLLFSLTVCRMFTLYAVLWCNKKLETLSNLGISERSVNGVRIG